MKPITDFDLQAILENARESWSVFNDRRWLLTGCTGFFGQWLTQSLVAASKQGLCRPQLVLLTRHIGTALENNPWLKNASFIEWVEGDIRQPLPPTTSFDGVIHGATSASTTFNLEHPEVMLNTIIEGTRCILREAQQRKVRDLLFISSGGIYGTQPSELTHVPESYVGGADPLKRGAAYGIGKRTAEFLCAEWARETEARVTMARCFAFVGPYLPLTAHFAIGNFINDALNGRNIQVNSDGSPFRSYLYGTDLAVWLLRLLSHGQNLKAYNVGSERDLPLGELAQLVLKIAHEEQPLQSQVRIIGAAVPGQKTLRYVPSTRLAREELNLKETVSLEDAIRRTLRWHRSFR